MNKEWFKNRANEKFDESIELLIKVKHNIQYIREVKETYGYELDTILFKGTFYTLDQIDNNINESLELVEINSIEGGTHKAVVQEIIVDGFNVYCPVCKELITDTYQPGVKYVHKCPYCNQKLDWEIESDLIGGNNNDL